MKQEIKVNLLKNQIKLKSLKPIKTKNEITLSDIILLLQTINKEESYLVEMKIRKLSINSK